MIHNPRFARSARTHRYRFHANRNRRCMREKWRGWQDVEDFEPMIRRIHSKQAGAVGRAIERMHMWALEVDEIPRLRGGKARSARHKSRGKRDRGRRNDGLSREHVHQVSRPIGFDKGTAHRGAHKTTARKC